MISLAVNLAVRANADTVAIGCNADDKEYFSDCREPFIAAMNQSVKSAGYNVEIVAPFIDWSKWKIADLSRQLGVPAHEIWTCYKGGAKPCGNCPACKKLTISLNK